MLGGLLQSWCKNIDRCVAFCGKDPSLCVFLDGLKLTGIGMKLSGIIRGISEVFSVNFRVKSTWLSQK